MEETGSGRWPAGRARVWELGTLGLILLLGAWLRLRELGLMEFKDDEALAVRIGRDILHGSIRTTGLTSSVGAKNPPLFVYLSALPLAVYDDPRAAAAFVGLLSVAAIALTYVVLRPRFGALVALAAPALFATAPWAVLYGRKIWAQDMLPFFTVGLLWALFVVLERSRTRTVWLVPVLLCLSFQLNFSAVALAVPVAAVLLYRLREVHWWALLAGVVVAFVLLSPWLAHEAKHGFEDVSRLVEESRGDGAVDPGDGGWAAVKQTFRIAGTGNWTYVGGVSPPSFTADAGAGWTAGRIAGVAAGVLLALGLLTCAVRATRAADRRRGWPWFELDGDAARRALLVVWIVGIWLASANSRPDKVAPHYLIVTYPVSFALQAIALADLAALARRRTRRAAAAAAGAAAALVAAGFLAFTLSFQQFLDDHGGTNGDYGVVYREKVELARTARLGGFGIANDGGAEFLVSGSLEPAEPRLVIVRNRLALHRPGRCDGEVARFGPLEACFPR